MKNIILIATSVTLLFVSCQGKSQTNKSTTLENVTPVQTQPVEGSYKAYFTSGCFWCVEAIYEDVKGVKEATSGYSGGHTENPTYDSSNTGRTGHAEAVEVIYDSNIISFSNLIDIYFGTQNPTQVNGQGPDQGSQYRSIIFYQNEKQKEIIEKKKDELGKKLDKKIAAEIKPFQKFWEAEEYHQDYERRNPNNPYIKNVSVPRLNKLKSKFPELVKDH